MATNVCFIPLQACEPRPSWLGRWRSDFTWTLVVDCGHCLKFGARIGDCELCSLWMWRAWTWRHHLVGHFPGGVAMGAEDCRDAAPVGAHCSSRGGALQCPGANALRSNSVLRCRLRGRVHGKAREAGVFAAEVTAGKESFYPSVCLLFCLSFVFYFVALVGT
jgi:hypothetical protein